MVRTPGQSIMHYVNMSVSLAFEHTIIAQSHACQCDVVQMIIDRTPW